jgi:hypothetical protein
VKHWKKIYQDSVPPKQERVAILISDQVDFKHTLGKQDKEGHFILNKRAKKSKRNNNYQPICTQCQCTQFHQTHTKGLKSTYKLQLSGSFNTTLSPIDRSSKQKNHQRNPRTKWNYKPNGLNWCQQHIASNKVTIYIVLSIPRNFLQNRSVMAQKKLQHIYENRNNPLHSFWSQFIKTRGWQ